MPTYPAGQRIKSIGGLKLGARSLIAQAIGILRAKGGSWWQPGPAYTFTGSDGTGAAGDGSDSGYGVDLCASYGPELVGAAWAGIFGGVPSLVGGTLTIAADGSSFYSGASQAISLQAGKLYQASYEVVDASQAAGVYLIVGSDSATAPPRSLTLGPHTAPGAYTAVFTAQAGAAGYLSVSAGNGGMTAGETITFRNISVREVIGRPLLQPTTSFKPKLKRVPKRLGPELVTNGDFANGTTGWSVAGAGANLAVTGGVATVSNGGSAEASLTLPNTSTGKAYQVTADVTALTITGTVYFVPPAGSSVANIPRSGVGQLQGTFASGGGSSRIAVGVSTAGASYSIDNVSVREVLEWTWAWQFDGVDDYMASAESSLSQSPDYALIVAFNSRNRSGYRLALGVFAPGGQDHMALIGEAGESPVLTQYSRDISGSGGPTPSVVTGVSSSVGGRKLRKNGVVVASAAYHPLTIEPRSIRMGLGVGGDNLAGEIFAAAYCPESLTDAELLAVEKAMAQLAGVTI